MLEHLKLADFEKLFADETIDITNVMHTETQLKIFSALVGIDKEELLDVSKKEFDELYPYVVSILSDKRIKQLQAETKNYIEIDSVVYTLIDENAVTVEEWAITETILADKTLADSLSDVLATMCRPAGEKLTQSLTAERKKMFQSVPLIDALPLIGFFLHREMQLNELIHLYTTTQKEKESNPTISELSQIFTDGTKQLTIWQKIKFWRLIKSNKKQ